MEAGDSIIIPVPALGMYVNHAFSKKWILRMNAGFLNLDIQDFEGRYLSERQLCLERVHRCEFVEAVAVIREFDTANREQEADRFPDASPVEVMKVNLPSHVVLCSCVQTVLRGPR